MKKIFFAVYASVFVVAICSCRMGGTQVEIPEVLVPGGKAVIGNDQYCTPYSATVRSLYVAKYETQWRSFATVMNYGLEKGYVEVKDGKLVPRVGLFPQYSNVIVDFAACAGSVSLVDGRIACGDDATLKPITNISWYGSALFCNILSEMNGLDPCYDTQTWEILKDANGYRLPTFEEWEYFARDGKAQSQHRYAGSDDPLAVGWFSANSGNAPHACGELAPNGLGLYDVSGNANEFCTETFRPIITTGKTAGSALHTSNRIWRGGSYLSDAVDVYYFCQNINNPEYYMPFADVGFRTVRSGR